MIGQPEGRSLLVMLRLFDNCQPLSDADVYRNFDGSVVDLGIRVKSGVNPVFPINYGQ